MSILNSMRKRGTIMFKKEIIIGGTGGQGIILSGVILAEAAVNDGNHVIQSQNYGPESRGGASRADVIISDKEIYYPKVKYADIFLALSQEAYNKYIKYTSENSIIIADSSVDGGKVRNIKSFNIVEYAYNILLKPYTVNMISIGIINSICNVVSDEAVIKSIKKNVPSGTFEINFTAYEAGLRLLKS
jgi:2-oxoglutarate ferredoxin oxidoreductase subunit gamma